MRAGPDTQQLTDLIYASLLGECSWQDFLDALRGVLPNGRAILFFHDTASGYGGFPLSSGFDADLLSLYNSYYSAVNPWMRGASARPLGRAVRADAMLPRKQLARTEFYSGFLRPQELISGVGVTVLREQQCNFLLSVLSADADDAAFSDAVASVQGTRAASPACIRVVPPGPQRRGGTVQGDRPRRQSPGRHDHARRRPQGPGRQ
jgi:hypothetical protein